MSEFVVENVAKSSAKSNKNVKQFRVLSTDGSRCDKLLLGNSIPGRERFFIFLRLYVLRMLLARVDL